MKSTMKGRSFGCGVILFSTVFCTTPVIAQSQTYYFAGKLNEPFGTLPSGTPFCGSFSYDRSQADNTPLIPYRGDYHYTNVSVTVDGVTVTDNGTGAMHVFDHGAGYPPGPADETVGYPTDLFYIYTFESSGALGGLTLAPSGLQLALQDITGAVFNGPSILGPDLSLSNFTTGNATFLQLQAESVIPPSPFPQSVTDRTRRAYGTVCIAFSVRSYRHTFSRNRRQHQPGHAAECEPRFDRHLHRHA